MNGTLVRSVVALFPVAVLLAWSIAIVFKQRTLGPMLQFLGTACLLIVVLTHVAEALHLFAFMRWGYPHSAGHYLDLSSAMLAVTVFPAGVMLRARNAAAERARRTDDERL